MAIENCFVIMAIGNQNIDGHNITQDELKKRYDDLIKEAILGARTNVEVVRADEVAVPGTITTDIITRIMHSDIVVVDVTYPNANVFYELGLRHACKPGTIIIRDKNGPNVPFDIAHLRYIEYENTPTGLKELTEKFRNYFAVYERDITRPDNQLLEIAKFLKFKFPDYSEPEVQKETEIILALLRDPKALEMMTKQAKGEKIDETEFIQIILQNPSVAGPLITEMVKTGALSLPGAGGKRRKRVIKR